jgi:hypothetical protein
LLSVPPELELLQPAGDGPAADFLARRGSGLFAAGFAVADLAALRDRLRHCGASFQEHGGQVFLAPEAIGVPGLRAVISADTGGVPTGLLRCLYEVTLLVEDAAAMLDRVAALFDLDGDHFVPIRSQQYGYQGALALFDRGRLDRIEVITPTDAAKTMGRFFAKRGAALYMCYAEADDLVPIQERLREHAPSDWTGSPEDGSQNNLFIHPSALGGMMMGISRTTFAWSWSGHPERVRQEAVP